MKTLAGPKDKEEILQRLRSVRPESVRKWGRMSAHQMICHLADSFRGAMGDKPLSEVPGFMPRKFIKWVALDVPVAWPKGVQTRPEIDQERGGTPPAEFAADVRELERLFERFARSPRDFSWQPHPIFGAMSERDWMRWGYLHMDHHLRQFGA
jgi:hypothetical protein